MDIGKEQRELTVHPLQWPQPAPASVPQEAPVPEPQEVEAERSAQSAAGRSRVPAWQMQRSGP